MRGEKAWVSNEQSGCISVKQSQQGALLSDPNIGFEKKSWISHFS